MTIKLVKTKTKKEFPNSYEVVYKGDYNYSDYLYAFNTITEDDFDFHVLMLDFYSKATQVQRGHEFDIRVETFDCVLNYFTDWFETNGYDIYNKDYLTDICETFYDYLEILPYDSNSGYGISSLDITLKKDNSEFKLKYEQEDIDRIIKDFLINNGLIEN
jgi:hypothetical protein